ncbi:MAG: hypothetical protein ABSG36_19040 [Acidimicrobiales bacterium]
MGYFRDKARHLSLCARIEDGLIPIEERVRAGSLVDPAKIGVAADASLDRHRSALLCHDDPKGLLLLGLR